MLFKYGDEVEWGEDGEVLEEEDGSSKETVDVDSGGKR